MANSGGGFGAITGTIGGLLGGLFNNDDEQKAAQARQDALDSITGVATPDDLADPIKLQQFLNGGTLTPEQLQKLNLNADKATTLIENPANRANEQASLNALKQLSQNGASATDQASLAAARSGVAQDTQAKIQSLLQQQQMRGQANAGSTLAAQLSAIQGGNQQASKDAMTTAANSETARNQALQQYSQLAGQIRNQDVGTQQYNTSNDIQRQNFLDQNSLSRQQGNTSANNNAALYNLQRSQSVGDTNTAAQNQEMARQKQAEQQLYQDKMQKATALNSQYMNNSNYYNQSAANTAQNWANAGSSLGAGADEFASMFGGGSSNGPSSSGQGANGAGEYAAPDTPKSGGGIGSLATMFAAHGGTVPGHINVSGDSYANDTVNAQLSPGEKVLPRSVADSPKKAAEFVKKQNKHPSSDMFKSLSDLFKHAHTMSKND